MTCKVIPINAERWVCVFNEGGVTAYVSSRGNVKFDAEQKNVLNPRQMLDLAITLSMAFGAEDLE